MQTAIIYKIVGTAEWDAARAAGRYTGSADDVRDGFIHFSTSQQVAATAAKYFAGRDDLLIVAYAAEPFGAALRFEAARGGDLFPHVYGTLDPAAALAVKPLPRSADGTFIVPTETA
jgi:uncharacterized protein (DUF952 family)